MATFPHEHRIISVIGSRWGVNIVMSIAFKFVWMRQLRSQMAFIATFYSASQIGSSIYPKDFAPVRYSSTRDRLGDVYIYRPMGKDSPIFAHADRRNVLPSFTVPFSGCVKSIVPDVRCSHQFPCLQSPNLLLQKCPLGYNLLHVTLGLHEDYNAAAVEIVAAQESFLKEISDVDTNDVVRSIYSLHRRFNA
jgi:hypothetical protein